MRYGRVVGIALAAGLLAPALAGGQELEGLRGVDAAEVRAALAAEGLAAGLADVGASLAASAWALRSSGYEPVGVGPSARGAGLRAYAVETAAAAGWRGEVPARPPASWAQEDPADSIWRAAREAANRGNWRRAAELFARIVEEHPDSEYAGEALYWDAFARYRLGGEDDLEVALRLLGRQEREYPDAVKADSRTLRTRIEGRLAALGNAGAAERVAAQAARAAERVERVPEARTSQEGCPDEEDDVRTAALNAMLHMDADQAMPLLKKVLERRDECSAPLRRRALFLISQKRTPETEEIMLDVARNDPDPEVRKQAVFWLSQVNTARAVEILQEILATSDDPELQERAVFALSQHRSEGAAEALKTYAMDGSKPDEIREKAIFWLGQHHSIEPAFLRQLYGRLESRDLKEKVFFALSQRRDEASVNWMLERVTDTSEPVELRKKALFWAAQGGASLARLENLYARMPDREMKEQLIFAYSQRSEPAAVDRLMEIAREEEDPELRKKAIFWLGQKAGDDPRVAEFLMELIEP